MSIEAAGQVTASTTLTNLTAGGGVGTKGSYVELIASTSNDTKTLTVQATSNVGTGNCFIIDIATGAASSEVDVAGMTIYILATREQRSFTIPLDIPSGTRISARCSCTAASQVCSVGVMLNTEGALTGNEATLLGASGGKGTVIDPGGSANTKGSWVQITGSSPHDIDELVFFLGGNANNALSNANFFFDIGVGAVSSEVVVVPNIFVTTTNFEIAGASVAMPVTIASGSRIAVRSQSNITDAIDRLMDVSILGVNTTAPSGGGGGGAWGHS